MRRYVALLERVATEPKVLLADLQVPGQTLDTPDAPDPLDALEARLAGIVAGLLGIEPAAVGRQCGFFELGGDSALALQLIEQVNKTYHTDLPVSLLLTSQTVGALAAALRRASASPNLEG
jgi:acyl carrier protein